MSDEFESDGGDTAESRAEWSSVPDSWWRSLQGQQIAATEQAEHEAIADWVITQDGVAIDSYGGFAPERWSGDVDGQRFSFRERHGQWDIEIDHQPSGRFIQQVAGTEPDGSPVYRTRELEVGKLVASGTTDVVGYGTTAVERAQFIVDTIRVYLIRQTCSHCPDKLDEITVALGAPARWCPCCGARLPAE